MYIVSIKTDNRKESIPEVQEVLTEYGKNIITRLGMHDNKDEYKGIILVSYTEENVEDFVEDLNAIEGTNVNFMEV